MKNRFIILLLLALTSCSFWKSSSSKETSEKRPDLTSITFVDKNGLSETIAEKDRLKAYENNNFLGQQSYQKVLRVYARDNTGKILSILTSYHDNGQIRQYLEARNGRAFGKYNEWYPSGQIRLQATVMEGKADLDKASMGSWVFDGPSQVYREDGTIEAEFPYSKGLLDGIALKYYPNKTISSKTLYKDGLKEGTEEFYFPSGMPHEILNYKDDYLDGEALGFYEDQTPCTKEIWKDGLLDKGTYYSKDGSILCSVENGTGKKAHFKDGNLVQTREFQHGDELGEVINYDHLSRITSRYHLKDGKKQGTEVRYFTVRDHKVNKEPLPKLSIEWCDGMLQGTIKTWYPSGTLESQREYMSNHKQGLSTAWYLDGTVMLIEEYEKDRLVRGEYHRRGEKNTISQVQHGKGTATLFDAHGALIKRTKYLDGLPQEN